MKSLRQQFTEEAIKEKQLAQDGGGTPTDMFKCGKCRGKNCTYTQVRVLMQVHT